MTHSFVPEMQPGEKVVAVLRRHWFTILGIAVVAILLAVIPFGVWRLLVLVAPDTLTHPVMRPILLLIGSTYYLAIWLFSFTDIIDYYLDTWTITTGRIINIEQHGLFRRVASELNLSSIQDVTSDTKGFLQTFFRYGNVFVQTAATHERFHLKNVPDAEHVKNTIMRLAEEDRLKETARS